MVKDKFQVRSTGPIHNLTHQPVKGRKVGGCIRLGEMERDSLLGHGVAYYLYDRLFHSSDESTVYLHPFSVFHCVCPRCVLFFLDANWILTSHLYFHFHLSHASPFAQCRPTCVAHVVQY